MKNRIIKNTAKVILISTLLLVESCATVPLIGRSQLSLVPESSMLELSLTNYNDFIKANKISTNKDQTATIKRVGAKMSAAVEKYLSENGFCRSGCRF